MDTVKFMLDQIAPGAVKCCNQALPYDTLAGPFWTFAGPFWGPRVSAWNTFHDTIKQARFK